MSDWSTRQSTAAVSLFLTVGLAVLIPLSTLVCDTGLGACVQSLSETQGALPALATMLSVLVAIVAFVVNAWVSTRQQRKQHTVNTLLQSRLSPEFRLHKERREEHFPEYRPISFKDWKAARDVKKAQAGKAATPHEAAMAVTELLNFYEFLALGVRLSDFDEPMLKKSVRGIMCNLVDDCRYLIGGIRVRSPLAYENLCWLYDQWRRPDAIDINGKPNERPIPTEPGNGDEWPDPPGG